MRTTDGRELTHEVLYPKGNPANPLTEDEFKAKFMDMAERVLGQAQADELRRLGCRSVQGYLYSRPLPAATFEAQWLGQPVSMPVY